MKLKLHLLVGAALSSFVSLSSFAQSVVLTPPPIQNGSSNSRAPLPAQRSFEFTRVTKTAPWTTDTVYSANHIGGLTSAQFAAAQTPASAGAVMIASTAPVVAPVVVTPAVAAGRSLDATQMGSQIRSDATASRDQLRDIEARVVVSTQSMAETRGTMAALTAEDQKQFNSANTDVQEKAQTLRNSIQVARNTETSGEQVATDFEAYAAAVARVDRIALAQR